MNGVDEHHSPFYELVIMMIYSHRFNNFLIKINNYRRVIVKSVKVGGREEKQTGEI